MSGHLPLRTNTMRLFEFQCGDHTITVEATCPVEAYGLANALLRQRGLFPDNFYGWEQSGPFRFYALFGAWD